VRTDGWNADAPLGETFGHQSVVVSRTGHSAHLALPGLHRVASLLERWPAAAACSSAGGSSKLSPPSPHARPRAGRALHAAALERVTATRQLLLDGLTADDYETVVDTLQHMARNLDGDENHP
jgi:hypothetical protein